MVEKILTKLYYGIKKKRLYLILKIIKVMRMNIGEENGIVKFI